MFASALAGQLQPSRRWTTFPRATGFLNAASFPFVRAIWGPCVRRREESAVSVEELGPAPVGPANTKSAWTPGARRWTLNCTFCRGGQKCSEEASLELTAFAAVSSDLCCAASLTSVGE